MKVAYAVNKNIMIIECDSRLLSESRNGANSALQYSEPTSGSAIGGQKKGSLMSLGRQSSIINNLLSAGSCKQGRRTSTSIMKMKNLQSNNQKEGGILDMSIQKFELMASNKKFEKSSTKKKLHES